MIDAGLLQQPTDRCARLVALSLLEDAEKAGDRLTHLSPQFRDGDAESDDALHDFRVAVRRLRSWLRAFEPELRDAVSRKQRRRLSEIADATGGSRDATVHLDWLREERAALTAPQRIGHAWLFERLEAQRKEGSEPALAAASDFVPLAAKLSRRMKVYRSAVLAQDQPAGFGASLVRQLLTESESLRDRLSAIHHVTDVDESHAARIAAKRLRYLTEPVSTLVADGDSIIETLKTLQDALGDLHDVHVFSAEVVAAVEEVAVSVVKHGARSRDPRPGLRRLARRLRERGARAYAGITRDWLNDSGAPFFDRVSDLAAEIARRASEGTEIERKYLLERLPEEALAAPSVEIAQGYLPGETLVERIRRVRSPDGTERWFRTVKVGSGLARLELEEQADVVVGRALWRLTKGRRVRKRRYSLREADGIVWQVDEYLDRALAVAEIELPAFDTEVALPPWLRAVMDREVTEEPEYANAHLAR